MFSKLKYKSLSPDIISLQCRKRVMKSKTYSHTERHSAPKILSTKFFGKGIQSAKQLGKSLEI